MFHMQYNLLFVSGCLPSYLLYIILSAAEFKKRRMKLEYTP
jgi:hypothetical protein